ncbi:hypothetical protein [Maridesulfovibrio sp. FT414]|uniref:hypothetical protein n=1 Tax=Maridesulfovibrio sp. FT414 TaxID=2979469 RepID=UPI003D808B06
MKNRYHLAVLRFFHRGQHVADVDLVTDESLEVCREEAFIRVVDRAAALKCDSGSDGELLLVVDAEPVWSSRELEAEYES